MSCTKLGFLFVCYLFLFLLVLETEFRALGILISALLLSYTLTPQLEFLNPTPYKAIEIFQLHYRMNILYKAHC